MKCDTLFVELNKFVKNNPPPPSSNNLHLGNNVFCILPVDFTDGSDDDVGCVLRRIVGELHIRDERKFEKTKKAMEFAEKNVRLYVGVKDTELVRTKDMCTVLHTYSMNGVYVLFTLLQKHRELGKD